MSMLFVCLFTISFPACLTLESEQNLMFGYATLTFGKLSKKAVLNFLFTRNLLCKSKKSLQKVIYKCRYS